MARREISKLTELESVIMDAVWRLGEATVREVQKHLEPVKPMAYNTVLTMMRILRDKGFLHSERVGRLDIYKARVSRDQVAKRSLHEVLERFFAGSASALVSQLLDSRQLNLEEVRAIRQEVNRKLRGSAQR